MQLHELLESVGLTIGMELLAQVLVDLNQDVDCQLDFGLFVKAIYLIKERNEREDEEDDETEAIPPVPIPNDDNAMEE